MAPMSRKTKLAIWLDQPQVIHFELPAAARVQHPAATGVLLRSVGLAYRPFADLAELEYALQAMGCSRRTSRDV